MLVIVGSTALQYHKLSRCEPKDIDMWCEESLKIEGIDLKVIPKDLLKLIPKDGYFATPDAIYTIKCSHLGWDNPMWDKHKIDVLWLKSKGCKIIPELFKELVEYWKKELGNKEFLTLDNSKEGFFNDHVDYKYDHDRLHELVSYPNRPMYEKCLKNNKEVLIDREKFDKMEFSNQVRMFREEITVIACERWLFNSYWSGSVSWYKAYTLSLRKTITNLTKNWATEFVVCNLEEFIKPDFSYFSNIISVLGGSMSKVDMSVFKGLVLNEEDLPEVIFDMCEGYINFGNDYVFKNENPYGVNFNTEEYKGLIKAYREEYNNEFYLYCEEKRISCGYEHLAREGGGEGGAEHCYGVFKFKGKTYKAEYSYQSYNGFDFDDILDTLREVKPVEKTITVYE